MNVNKKNCVSFFLNRRLNTSKIVQMQPPRGVLRKMCSENKQQIYRRAPMSKCDFNKVALRNGRWYKKSCR